MAILVKFRKDWADEFEVQNFYAKKNATIEEEQENIRQSWNENEEISFGTNDGWEKDDFNEFDYEITQISDTEFDILYNLFDGRRGDYVGFGTGIW